MLTAAQRKMIRENVSEDKITFKKDGTVEFKRGYFYHMGQTPDGVAARATASLAKIGLKAVTIDTRDEFRAWPRDSWLVAVLKIEAAS
jgi:hypothetical protein